jgi:hypothetical protein
MIRTWRGKEIGGGTRGSILEERRGRFSGIAKRRLRSVGYRLRLRYRRVKSHRGDRSHNRQVSAETIFLHASDPRVRDRTFDLEVKTLKARLKFGFVTIT